MLGVLSGQGKTTLTVHICVLGVLSGQGKTTFTVYICVLGVLLGQGKTTLTVHVCIIPLSDLAGLDIRTRNGLYQLLIFKCSFYVL